VVRLVKDKAEDGSEAAVTAVAEPTAEETSQTFIKPIAAEIQVEAAENPEGVDFSSAPKELNQDTEESVS
jgi:hypothetical protein